MYSLLYLLFNVIHFKWIFKPEVIKKKYKKNRQINNTQ